MKRYDEALPHNYDRNTEEMGRSIAEQVTEIIAETIDELSLMTMAYPDNRMVPDDDFDGEDSPVVQMLERWADRYTPFHNDFFQNTRS